MWRGIFVVIIVALGLVPFAPLWAKDDLAAHVLLDVSAAPDAGEFALKSNALLLEWYPKINAILYDPQHPLPYSEIRVVFEPVLILKGAPALAKGNELHVSSEYIKHMPDDFRAMMIHELTHINQHYVFMQMDSGWLVEGIADYVRHKYYEKDIQPTLRLNANGQLTGYTPVDPYFYGLQQAGASLTDRGYLKAYTIASTFLFWLESHKDPQIIHELNVVLSQGKFSNASFPQLTGQTLDELWAEFVAESKKTISAH